MRYPLLSFLASTVLCCIVSLSSFAAVVNLGAEADVDIRSKDLADNGYNRDVNLVGYTNADPSAGRDYKAYLRFELPVDFGTANSVTFNMSRRVAGVFGSSYNVAGLNDGTADNWREIDGTGIGPVGSDPNVVGVSWNNAPGNDTTSPFLFTDSSIVGTFQTLSQNAGGVSGDSISMSTAGLANFLNTDTNGLVTLMVGRTQLSSSFDQWASSETPLFSPPELVLDYTPLVIDWAAEASQHWDSWRQGRSGVMPTASWSYFVRYDGTVTEYDTYRNAGLNMVNVPRLPLGSFPDPSHQYGNAITAGGLGILLGQFENLHESTTKLRNAVQLAESSGGSVIGYTLEDEPEPDQFADLAEAHRYIYRYDSSGALPIVNLLPNWAWNGSRQATYGVNYDGYVQQFIDEVNPAVLMHTHYPTLADGSDRADYYGNLELFRTKGLVNDIGVMGYVLVTDHTVAGPYRRPSASDLRWQVNSHLAYGAKGIYYYNYRIGDAGFGEGLVDDATGAPTDQYSKVSAINDSVQGIAPVLMQLTSTGIYHTGASLPTDTTQYTTAVAAPIHDFLDDDFVIGVFENGDVPSTDRYVYLVNKLHDANLDTDLSIFQTASFTLDAMFNTVFAYDSMGIEQLLLSTGTFNGRNLFEYGLEGGEGVLMRLTFLAGVTGDYNGNGIVDAADYTLWRDTLGSTTNLVADGNGNNIIDQGDYDVWKMNFGNSASGTTGVPEPASFTLLMFSVVVISLRRTKG